MKKYLAFIFMAMFILMMPSAAQAQNVATGLLDSFVNQTSGWWAILRGYALFLFTLTLTIEVCLFGIRMALQQSQIHEVIGQFITVLLFAAFIAAVINNYQSWATGIAITGLKPLVGQLTGNSVDAGQPFAIAAAIIDKILVVMTDFDVWNIVEGLLYVSVLLIIIVVFVLISALVIITTCEFYIIANVGILLIGLGGSKIFKDYAVNVMRYVLSVAIKLFVLQLIVNIGFAMLSLNDLDSSIGGTLSEIKFVDLFYLIGKSIILLALAKSLPETCAGIISGSNIGGGNPLVSVGRSAAAVAAGAVSGGVAGAAMAAASHTIAKGDPSAGGMGASGVGQTMLGMAKAAWGAHKQADINKNPGSMKNQLLSSANSIKTAASLGGGSDTASPSSGGGSGQAAPQSAPVSDGSGQTSSDAGAGKPASQLPNATNSALVPEGSGSDSSQPPAPPASSAGGSGQLAPTAADDAAPAAKPKSRPAQDLSNTATKPSKPKKPKGTVDMTSYKPKK